MTVVGCYPDWNVEFLEISAEERRDLRGTILNSDLRHLKIAHTLPPKIREIKDALAISSNKHILQIQKVEDACHPSQHCGGTGFFKEHSILLLHLCDVSGQRFSAMELEPLDDPKRRNNKLQAGEKILLGPLVYCKNGILLLTPSNCKLLGGRVEKILSQQAKNGKDKILWLDAMSAADKKKMRFLPPSEQPPPYVSYERENSSLFREKEERKRLALECGGKEDWDEEDWGEEDWYEGGNWSNPATGRGSSGGGGGNNGWSEHRGGNWNEKGGKNYSNNWGESSSGGKNYGQKRW